MKGLAVTGNRLVRWKRKRNLMETEILGVLSYLSWPDVYYYCLTNSVPESSLYINKVLLDPHGTTLKEDTIVALRFSKLIIYVYVNETETSL